MAGRRLSSNDVSVVIALAIVVLVLLLIFIVERGDREEAEAMPGRGIAARDRESIGLAVSSAAETPLGEARAAGRTEACGGGAIKVVADGQSDEEARFAVEGRRDEAAESILAATAASADPRARAAGLYFRATRDRIDANGAEPCRESAERCDLRRQRHEGDRGSRDALARLAVDSNDPQIYAWAYRSCATVARDATGSCQLVNALQWARLDPANAEPWLAVAREAKSRNDAAGLDDAMFHVAASTLHDAGRGRMVAQVVAAAPDADAAVVGTWLVSMDAAGYETVDLVSFADSQRYCDSRSIANANRRDTCEKIATLLVDRSTTLIGRAVGTSLGKRLGWPPERLAPFEQERDAAQAVRLREEPHPDELLSCTNVRRELAQWAAVGRLGEVEAARRQIAATGESIATLAAESRQTARLAQEAEAARAAASAASAAVAPSPYSSAPPPAR